jgi:hypothetical protein
VAASSQKSGATTVFSSSPMAFSLAAMSKTHQICGDAALFVQKPFVDF